MTSGTVEWRFRSFLLATAAFLFVGTTVELWFVEHTVGWAQLLPFGLCAMGLCTVVAAMYAPAPGILYLTRVVMGIIAAGSIYGIVSHFNGNLGFALEIRPNAGVDDVLGDALRGANPLLAPGILAVAAVLAAAATYAHPALKEAAGPRRMREG